MMESQEIRKTNKKINTFFSGVMILTLSTVLVKIVGLLYKIPMLHCLGSVGMGYFNAAYEWYALISVLATAGLPIASSMMIAEERGREREAASEYRVLQIERICLKIFATIGAVGCAVLLLGAPWIARSIGSPMTAPALMAVAPTVLFSCLSASYRGYFQGFQNMLPTALSQLIEAVAKLVLGVSFALWALRQGWQTPYVAAAAMLGLSIGVALSCLYLMICRMKQGVNVKRAAKVAVRSLPHGSRQRELLRRLVLLAVPITVSSSVFSLTKIVDMTLILRRLQHLGMESEAANALYGIYTTVTVPIFNLIPALLTSVALPLIPTLSAQIEAKDVQGQGETVNTAMRLTALLSIPASLALALYSKPIISLLFGISGAELGTSASLLTALSVSVAFSGMITTTNAILQAYGQAKLPIISMLIGSAIKLLSAAILIGIPSVNIYGAPLSTLLCNSVIVGINLHMIAKHSSIAESLRRVLLRPLLAAVPSVGLPALLFALLSSYGWNERVLFVAMVPVTLVMMAALSLKSGILGAQELEGIANGKIYRLLQRRLRFLLPKKL